MPQVRQLSIGNIPTVVSNGKSQLQVPKYGRVYGFFLECLNGSTPLTDLQLANDLALIRLVADGEDIHSISGRDLMIWLNSQFEGYKNAGMFVTPNTGTLFLPLVHLESPDAINQLTTALGTADIQNLFLELTFGAGITATRVGVTMLHDLVAAPWTQYFSTATYPQTLVGGVNEIQQLPKEKDVVINQYMIVNGNTTNSLDYSEVIINSVPVLQLSRNQGIMQAALYKRRNQVPASGSGAAFTGVDATILDFNPTKDLSSGQPLNGVTDQRLKFTYSGATPGGAVNIVRFANRNRAMR